MALQLRHASTFSAQPLPDGSQPAEPTPAPAPPATTETAETAPPQVPYPSTPPSPIPFVPSRSWFQERPWVAPVGTGILGLLLGLTVGIAAGRRRRATI